MNKPLKLSPSSRVPLERSIGYHVRQLSESLTDAVHRKFEARGVTEGQWRYLRELWEEDGLSQRELSERVGRQGPTTVAAVKSLERAGLATVAPSDHDRRKTVVRLTRRGRTLKDELLRFVVEAEAQAFDGLAAEEIAAFKRLVVRIQRNLDKRSSARNAWARWRTDHLAQQIDS